MQYLDKHKEYLEKRIEHLEEIGRFTLDALEMAASLGDFQPSINKLQEPSIILGETRLRIQRLMQFVATAFYLVDEETNDFKLEEVEPRDHIGYIEQEVDHLIEIGTFAWALREKRPVIVSTRDLKKQLILHVMATSSRIRGMFIGLIEKDTFGIPDISLSLLSIVLLNSSNALESFELYNMVKEINKSLESKKNYRLLFDAAPDGVEVLDARGNIVDCNGTLETLLHSSREAIIGKHTTDFFTDACKGIFEPRLWILKKTGYFEGEAELISGRGSIVPVLRKEKAIYDEKMIFVGSVVYNQDLSAIKKAEEEKKSLEAQLQRAQKMEALGTLAGGVAHDLNNILVGIVGYPELLLMRLPQDSPMRKPIHAIQKSGEKAAAIVQDLLTLARRGVAVNEVVNLNYIVLDYFKTPEHKRLSARHPLVTFESHLEEGLLNILGSPVHLSKTVMNLISNAVEAVSHEGKIITSTSNEYIDSPIRGYDQVQEGDYIVLTVSDTGIGIPPEDIERIFEPFYTRKVMGRSGTGLGLAVVWGTVKDHGGYIDVQSVEGKGTTFKLFFPVTGEAPEQGEHTTSADAFCGNGEKILIIDDAEEQREIASQMLAGLGYVVTAVSNGHDAIEYMKSHSVDLLVLDMIMQTEMDGLETYKRILEIHPGQRAVIVSGYSETGRVREAQRMGAGIYIKKPFLFEALAMAVKSELDK
jgi:PAS domain S-box-containing protein